MSQQEGTSGFSGVTTVSYLPALENFQHQSSIKYQRNSLEFKSFSKFHTNSICSAELMSGQMSLAIRLSHIGFYAQQFIAVNLRLFLSVSSELTIEINIRRFAWIRRNVCLIVSNVCIKIHLAKPQKLKKIHIFPSVFVAALELFIFSATFWHLFIFL